MCSDLSHQTDKSSFSVVSGANVAKNGVKVGEEKAAASGSKRKIEEVEQPAAPAAMEVDEAAPAEKKVSANKRRR